MASEKTIDVTVNVEGDPQLAALAETVRQASARLRALGAARKALDEKRSDLARQIHEASCELDRARGALLALVEGSAG